ncbi:unnamed protein product [Adineta steineri]|uniref:poly(ADP-ribose) glycohydrolase n=1 Tax=Adineta steineri TaxID=433720 RepID=A0A814G6C3_9BILA|nr:unnamed protein product [Adineta steineri]
MCDTDTATVENLTETIQNCIRHRCDMNSLEKLINEIYSIDERRHFMSTVLSNICSLALNVGLVCPQPLPLLRTGLNRSVTMSQKQVASLLACSFFCLFPNRSYSKHRNKFSSFPHANFISLYKTGHPKNIEKLKCILHYFRRITEEMPNGVITIRRFSLPKQFLPLWHKSHTSLCDLHLTTSKKIEEVQNTLQADFANKYIGGGVLGSGCVQEEIRFSICPEMLVSLLVCEVMEDNECIFLIGCEQYSSYKGYANSFQFDGDYRDPTPKDTWGRKWCHLVAMDAIYFRDPSKQYNMKAVDRELIKAYTSFYPLGRGPNYEFGITTGNWGCGAFNGDRYLKAIIQWMAASEAKRPLIYAAYRNKNLTPPLLRQKSNHSLTMSQQQAASLLACSFFCLFPTIYDEEKQHENFQEPNFHRLYQKGPSENIEKLKCILNYFRRITEEMPSGIITIQRYELPKESYPNWSNSKTGLSQLCLTKEKKIEDIKNVLQVDFANKYIGGGVLGSGCVQEEIRFSISPEMLVSLLVCEVMQDDECIFLIGCERYSLYTGYANSFQFAGDYRDTTPKDNWGRKWCHLVAMDAIYFRVPSTQYQKENVDRELIKAYASFRPLEKESGFEFGIATGNWGCGVFNGDKELKAIIQLMAASEARRPLIYAAFNDENLFYSFIKVYEYLKQHRATNMCDTDTATVENLTETIQNCIRHRCDMNSLEKLINEIYSIDERRHFMSTVLSNICSLALNVGLVCPQPPPLLRTGSNRSVTMSQKQVASLLACSFFCLFPNRSYSKHRNKFSSFPHANFISLYKTGHPKNIEKLKCILHYFRRITEEMPNGVITIRRFSLPKQYLPLWHKSHTSLCDLHLTTSKKIEEVQNTLQADFANKYIGGGVLGSGCVQEEIRFSICPEMLVSLLVCEVMEDNECIFLIGCEQYSSYRGYANSFQFDGDYRDTTLKDTWGRKWCHLVAMDAIYFRDPSKQYNMKAIDRELIKAYTSFYPLGRGPNYEFGIATGNWGCGAFNGDRYLKAIIQWMAASEAKRPLIYAAYRNKNLVNSFNVVYEYLKDQKATVADLYQYIQRYLTQVERGTLFEYILNTPVSFLK